MQCECLQARNGILYDTNPYHIARHASISNTILITSQPDPLLSIFVHPFLHLCFFQPAVWLEGEVLGVILTLDKTILIKMFVYSFD